MHPALRTRPLLKWAGNKFRALEHIQPLLPQGKRLIEPFAGSAAVTLNTHYPRYALSDDNADLITLYKILKQDGEAFIEECRRLFRESNNRADAYYRLRDRFNASDDARERAALFVYLNRHGYNGLCRYNSKGGFNVPFGSYKQPKFPQEQMLAFAKKAARITLRHEDFRVAMARAKEGDVVYCDPPYVPLSSTANFINYSSGGFDLDVQRELAILAREVARRGATVLVSNHDTEDTKKFYVEARTTYFDVRRYISCNGKKRTHVREVLALYT